MVCSVLTPCGAMEIGADGFIRRPFSHLELLARIQAVLWRCHNKPTRDGESCFVVDGLYIDFDSYEVTAHGEGVKLTPTEFGTLRFLTKNSERIMSASAIAQNGWGQNVPDANLLIKVHIQHLRKKLGDDPISPRYIFTEREIGYKFVRPELLEA